MSFWFDPMVQTAGMPGYVGAVEQGQAYNASIAAQQAQQNAMLAQANAYNPWANTPGGFGGQTAYYAGLGAAYGRQVPASSKAAVAAQQPRVLTRAPGGSNNAIPGGSPSGTVERGPDLPQPDLGGYNPFDSNTWSAPRTPAQPAVNPYARMYRMPEANANYFNPGTYAGSKGNYGIPYNGQPQAGDIGFSRQRTMPNLGYNPGMQHLFANPGMNANQFQNRFGMGFPNAGTPSEVRPMHGSGDTLTPMDRYGDPFQIIPGGG